MPLVSSVRFFRPAVVRTALGFVGLVTLGVLAAAPLLADHAAEGKATFLAQKCQTCHAVAAAGIEATVKSPKMLGPDLSGYETEDFEALASFLRRETKIDGTAHTRPFKGTDEELQAICAWLETLEPVEAAAPETASEAAETSGSTN